MYNKADLIRLGTFTSERCWSPDPHFQFLCRSQSFAVLSGNHALLSRTRPLYKHFAVKAFESDEIVYVNIFWKCIEHSLNFSQNNLELNPLELMKTKENVYFLILFTS